MSATQTVWSGLSRLGEFRFFEGVRSIAGGRGDEWARSRDRRAGVGHGRSQSLDVSSASIILRISNFCALPVTVMAKDSTIRTWRGTL